MTDITIPQSPITAQSNPVVLPAPAFKKKSKTGKIVVGIVTLLLVALGGFGYYYFTAGEPLQINCVGYFECLEWKKNRDAQDQINANSTQAQYGGYAGGGTGPNSNLGQGNYEGIEQAKKLAKDTGVSVDAYLAAAQKMEDGVATDAEKKIIADAAAKLLVDAAAAKAKQDAIKAGQVNYTKDNCVSISGNTSCTGDLCLDSGGTWKGDNCWMGSSATCEGPLTGIGGDPCAANGGVCAGTDVIRCKCGNSWVGGRASAGCSSLCTSAGLTCANSCEPPPDPSIPPNPTMKCDGLTSVPTTTPTAPTIGTKLTFTCAGTVTPSSAGTLSYKFRYSINSGTPVTLTPLTATPNKAELTINACGTYSVQCQACATLNGVLTCNPTWTAATQ